MTIASPSTPISKTPFLVLALALVTLVVMFVIAPLPANVYVGEDWAVFRSAALRVAHGNPHIYGVDFHPEHPWNYFFYNAPWLAVALTPVAVLPERVGWALLSTATLAGTIALVWRWAKPKPGLLKTLLALISPPVILIIVHGQIDALIVAAVWLPPEWWPLVLTAKPQTAIALILGVPRDRWLRAAVILGTAVVLSLLLFGFWPRPLAHSVTDSSANITRGAQSVAWPLRLAIGAALAAWGARKRDERVLIAASPLLSSYVTVHSLYGAWIVLVSTLDRRYVALLWVLFWAWLLVPKFM
jgi:hypothetical protein